MLGKAETVVKSGAESAVADALGGEVLAVDADACIAHVQDVGENGAETVVAGNARPLHFVLVDAGRKAEQLSDAAEEIAEGIGRVVLLLQGELIAAGAP